MAKENYEMKLRLALSILSGRRSADGHFKRFELELLDLDDDPEIEEPDDPTPNEIREAAEDIVFWEIMRAGGHLIDTWNQ